MSEQEKIEKFRQQFAHFERYQRSKLVKFFDFLMGMFYILSGIRC